jgi:hypothetical protein
MRKAASARNAGFIRQAYNQRLSLLDKSGVPVVISRCAPPPAFQNLASFALLLIIRPPNAIHS